MTQAVDVVVIATAPMLLLFVVLTGVLRRHGGLHWMVAYVATWLAAGCDALGGPFVGPGLGLGLLTSLLFYTGARSYRGRALERPTLVGLTVLLPGTLALLTSLAGTAVGYGVLAAADGALLLLSAWHTRAVADQAMLPMARLLPFAFLGLLPIDVYYHVARMLDRSADVPTLAMSTALVSLAAVILLALVSIRTREETLLRERLEATVEAQQDELRESEEKVRSAERLAAVGTLAAGIAHQINNPIGAILAAAQYARVVASGDPASEAERVEAFEAIEREALRCARIVRNVLLFARPGRGAFGIHDLNRIVELARAAVEPDAASRGARLELRLAEGPLPVRGNEIELEQVLVNLIRNGLETRPRGARVVVETAGGEGDVECRVRDDGPGLDPEVRRRLFEPFFTTKLREGGTGLGLSVAHGIARSHAGRIELLEPEGARPAGTCFRLVLPREAEAEAWPLEARRAGATG